MYGGVYEGLVNNAPVYVPTTYNTSIITDNYAKLSFENGVLSYTYFNGELGPIDGGMFAVADDTVAYVYNTITKQLEVLDINRLNELDEMEGTLTVQLKSTKDESVKAIYLTHATV